MKTTSYQSQFMLFFGIAVLFFNSAMASLWVFAYSLDKFGEWARFPSILSGLISFCVFIFIGGCSLSCAKDVIDEEMARRHNEKKALQNELSGGGK